MNTDSVWSILQAIPIGTVVAWIVVFITIISAICALIIKLYKIFEKTHQLKEENDDFKTLVESHTERLNQFGKTLSEIKNALDEQKEVNLKELRHEIVRSCELALKNNVISTSALCSLEEMYEEYKNVFHGNGYVKTLIEKVRKLDIDKDFED